jgi:hypothetical protein
VAGNSGGYGTTGAPSATPPAGTAASPAKH